MGPAVRIPLQIRHIGLIMRNECQDALRSRRALVVILLFMAAALLTMNGFLTILLRLENELAETLQLPAAEQPGAVVDALWRSDRFHRMVARAVRSEELVRDLVGMSPIALVYAGLLFFYTPLLVALAAPVRVAEELAGGSVRYVLIRASRLSWSVGKFLGQAAVLVVALLCSGLGAWVLVRMRMAGASDWRHGAEMLFWAGRAWVYGMAFLGMVLGVAHVTRSPSRCTAIALLTVFLVGTLAWASERYAGPGWRQMGYVIHPLLPQAHRLDLWRSSAAHAVPAAVMLLALGTGYLLAGYAWFRRRDT